VREGLLKGLAAKQRRRRARAWYDRVGPIAERLFDKGDTGELPWFWQGEHASFIARDMVNYCALIALATNPDDPFPSPVAQRPPHTDEAARTR
jgi:hypothetical protein